MWPSSDPAFQEEGDWPGPQGEGGMAWPQSGVRRRGMASIYSSCWAWEFSGREGMAVLFGTALSHPNFSNPWEAL